MASKARPRQLAKANRTRPAKFEPLDPPADWQQMWELIVDLRADRTAIVDSMGCEALCDAGTDDDKRNYQTLISMMLSSQTKVATWY